MGAYVNIVFPLVTMFISIIAVLVEHFKVVASILSRLTEVETKTELFWKVVESNIPKLLKLPHTEVKDKLLDKMAEGTLSYDEASQLKKMLENEIHDAPKELYIGYVLVLARLEQIVKAEANADANKVIKK